MIKPLQILLDFDGTSTSHEFPRIGKDIGAVPVLKELVAAGHKLILFTMRSDVENPTRENEYFEIIPQPGQYLTEAVNWFKENEIALYGIQTCPNQHTWTKSPKAYGNLIIDDTNLGIPLKTDLSISSRPFVDWKKVRDILVEMNILK